MKIDAEVELSESKENDYGQSFVKIPVDIDYVEANHDSINEWVRNALEEKFNGVFYDDDFEVVNIEAIIEEIAFDEFQDKIN